MDPIAAGARLHPVWFRHACTSSLRRVDVPEDMRQRGCACGGVRQRDVLRCDL